MTEQCVCSDPGLVEPEGGEPNGVERTPEPGRLCYVRRVDPSS
jgi:hypothetical protein